MRQFTGTIEVTMKVRMHVDLNYDNPPPASPGPVQILKALAGQESPVTITASNQEAVLKYEDVEAVNLTEVPN